MEWLSDNLWAVWLCLGLVLATAELLTLDLTLIMLSTGAFAACLVALGLPDVVWLQCVVAAVVSCSTLFFLRPSLLAKFRSAPGYSSSIESMVGSSALAVSTITPQRGDIKIDGQLWSAVTSSPGQFIEPGATVTITAIDGVTAVVAPVRPELP